MGPIWYSTTMIRSFCPRTLENHVREQIYIYHIHLLNLKPKKWLQSDEVPTVGDFVLFVVNDALAALKEDAEWKVGRAQNRRYSERGY